MCLLVATKQGDFVENQRLPGGRFFIAADDDVLGALMNLGIGENLPKLKNTGRS